MKKITLLLSFIVCVVFAQAQTNLVVNPSFETWTGGNPDGWTIQSPSNGSVSVSTEKVLDGTSSLKVTGGSGTFPVWQSVPVTVGKTYILSMSYYIESGDNTDARIWSGFKNGTTLFSENEMIATTYYSILRGPGCENLNGSSYFPDVKGEWKTYTVEFLVPANTTHFNFEFRTYKNPAVVYWDKISLVQKNTTGTSNPTEDALQAFVSGKNLMIQNAVAGSTVEIYSALGSKVQTSTLEDGKVSLDNLSKGLYVVRIGKKAQKFML